MTPNQEELLLELIKRAAYIQQQNELIKAILDIENLAFENIKDLIVLYKEKYIDLLN